MQSPDLAPFRAALDTLLQAHLPYPAMVLDGHWTVLLANAACTRLYGGDVVSANIVRRFASDPAAQQAIINWPEVACAGLDRLRHQADLAPFDESLAELVGLAEAAVVGTARPDTPSPALVVCPWFRVGEQVVKTIGIAARFDGAAEITPRRAAYRAGLPGGRAERPVLPPTRLVHRAQAGHIRLR